MKIVLFVVLSTFLFAQGVPAGTKIENQAKLEYRLGDNNITVYSNKVIDTVDQKLDMKIVCQEAEEVIVGVSEVKRALTFRLVNSGNGSDNYLFSPLSGAESNFNVLNPEIYLDNGDGIFSLANDKLVEEMNLSADGNATLFFVGDIPDDADKYSDNGIKVASEKQEGLAYGESKQVDDYYALMAVEEESLSDLCRYKVSHLAIELEKTATLSSDALYRGTTIHYKIALRVKGTGVIRNVLVEDLIPEGTEYLPNSLQLNGEEYGDFNGTAISVNVGEITQEVESDEPQHFVTFDVKVI